MRFTNGDAMDDNDYEFTGPYGGPNQTPRIIDMTGAQCGAWTVVRFHSSTNRYETARWICRCICGAERSVSGASLRSGISRGCGCSQSRRYNRRNGE